MSYNLYRCEQQFQEVEFIPDTTDSATSSTAGRHASKKTADLSKHPEHQERVRVSYGSWLLHFLEDGFPLGEPAEYGFFLARGVPVRIL